MGGQAEAPCQGRGRFDITGVQDLAVEGVLQCQQARAREVWIDRFDGGLDLLQRQGAVGLVLDRLRLDTAQHRGATALHAIGVRLLADDVLVAALAVAQQRHQIALGAGGEEQCCRLAGALGSIGFQARHARVVAPDVVTERGIEHHLTHRLAWAGDGVAAEIDHGDSLVKVVGVDG